MLWNKIINTGVKPHLPSEEIRKIRLLNGILLTGEILFLILILKSLASGLKAEYIVQAIGAIIFIVPILFNFLGLYRVAKLLCIIIPVIYFTFLTIYWGSDRGSQLIIIAVAALVVLFFENKTTIFFLVLIASIGIIISEVYNFKYEQFYFPPNVEIAYLINVIITILMIITITAIFKKENYEYLKKIASYNSKLTQQHEKGLELNKHLTTSLDVIKEQKAAIDEVHKRLQDSINYAKTIQQAILTVSPDVKSIIPDHFILFRPRDVVSGDFYYLFTRNSKVFVAAVDCTGHGVPGAFMSMISHSFLQEAIETDQIDDPGQILHFLNNKIINALKQSNTSNNDGMDIGIAMLDRNTNHLHFAGAKNSLIFIQNDQLQEIKGDRYAIGGFTPAEYEFQTSTFTVNKGDSFYLMSDGFQDQFGGPDNKKFRSRRLRSLIKNMQSSSIQEQHDTLSLVLKTWMNESEQTDDILVIGVKV